MGDSRLAKKEQENFDSLLQSVHFEVSEEK